MIEPSDVFCLLRMLADLDCARLKIFPSDPPLTSAEVFKAAVWRLTNDRERGMPLWRGGRLLFRGEEGIYLPQKVVRLEEVRQ